MNFEYIDESLDVNATNLYHLSIQVGQDGFSFCILDTIRNKFIVLKNLPYELKSSTALARKVKEIHQEEYLLRFPYKSVSAIFCSKRATCIPSEFYDAQYAEKTLLFNHPFIQGEKTVNDTIPGAWSYLIYSIPVNLEETLKNLFPGIILHHHTFPFITNAFKVAKDNETKVFINQNLDFIDLLVVRKGKMIMLNHFTVKSERDFLYFSLYVFEQLKLDTEKTEVILSGFIGKEKPIYLLLKKYIKHITIDAPDNRFLYSYTFNKTPLHYFKNLLNQYKCE
ncbi:MAG: DUF3822 family protein [Bacteroidota bacterium]|nr:DUF3822 family protein [Bacteroidota bacterium]MDP4204938.1 DUF3822 family protein [Bacteroidota bacterium]